MATLRKLFPCFGWKRKPNTEENIEISELTSVPANRAPTPQVTIPRERPRPAHIPDFRGASQRQKDEECPGQSQSDASQPRAKPQSLESSTKRESDRDEGTSAKASTQSPGSATRGDTDQDEITPVEPQGKRWSTVTDALEDRRTLLERLRCPKVATGPVVDSGTSQRQQPPEQPEGA